MGARDERAVRRLLASLAAGLLLGTAAGAGTSLAGILGVPGTGAAAAQGLGAAADTTVGETVPVAGGPVPVRASPGLAVLARNLVEHPATWAPMPGIGGPDAWFDRPPTIWIVEDYAMVPGGGPGRREEEWAAGFADFDRNLIAVRAGEEGPGRLGSLRRTLRHELAHLALHRATGGNAPRWLHEGYAQLVAGGWDWDTAWKIRFALMRGESSLHSLSLDFPREEEAARTAYLLSYTAVQMLARGPQGAALGSLFERLREGATLDVAVRDVYAMTLDQFEERWRKQVKGRYGWLFLLSRASLFWVALTVALLLLGWRRWRYQKKRWEELREREAREEAFWSRLLGGPPPSSPERESGSDGAGSEASQDALTEGDPRSNVEES